MNYPSADQTIVPDFFKQLITIMYMRSGKKATTEQVMGWYRDFGKYPDDILKNACRRIGQSGSTYAITWRVITDAINDVTPVVTITGKVGCTYCDTLGMIDYWKEINGRQYQYSARCHKCRTSRYTNSPFYNEIFPNDDIQPHSTPEQMKSGKHIVEDIVRVLTGREHEGFEQKQKRKRTLQREHAIENAL
jgi:hypothetical protein